MNTGFIKNVTVHLRITFCLQYTDKHILWIKTCQHERNCIHIHTPIMSFPLGPSHNALNLTLDSTTKFFINKPYYHKILS